MKSEIKKFVTGLGLSTEMTAFLLANKLSFTITNIVKEKNGTVSFDAVSDYWKVEKTTLTKDEQPVWDLYHDFNSNKNAANVLMNAIETKTRITDESYDSQSKITPSTGALKSMTFVEFWGSLTQEQKTEGVVIGKQWLQENHIFKTSFEFFAINDQDVTFEEGDYLLGYDETYGTRLATRVLQASPNGFITCVDGEGLFSMGHFFRPEKVAKESLNAKVVEIIDNMYDGLNAESSQMKIDRIEKAIDIADRRAKASAKAFDSINDAKITTLGLLERYNTMFDKNINYFTKEERDILSEKLVTAKKTITEGIEAVKKASEEKLKEFDRLMALKLTSKDAIAKAVGDANKVKLTKELAEKFKAKVKDATEKLKAEATPQTENAPTEAPTEATPKGTRKPKAPTNEAEHSKNK